MVEVSYPEILATRLNHPKLDNTNGAVYYVLFIDLVPGSHHIYSTITLTGIKNGSCTRDNYIETIWWTVNPFEVIRALPGPLWMCLTASYRDLADCENVYHYSLDIVLLH